MRILYLNADRGIPVLGEKGASVHVRSFVTALAALGHEVSLVCAQAGSGNPPPPCRLIEQRPQADQDAIRAECRALDLAPAWVEDTVLRSELARLAHDRGLAERAIAALDEAGFVPDLIYERQALFHTAGVALAAHYGVPRLLEVNAPLVEEQARFRGLRLRDVAQAREDASYAGADLVVAVSDAVGRHVTGRGIDPARVLVAANGVDTARFRADQAPGLTLTTGAALRGRLGLEQALVIGFVGSFKAWHGIDFLLDAFTTLAPRFPAARLLAVGDGPMLEAARQRVRNEGLDGRVIFTGAVPHAEVPAYLQAMDLTVAPYAAQQEFYFSPLKIVESMAAGRPVVAPRIGQIVRLVSSGVNGLLYPPDDLAACIARIALLLDDSGLRARLGERAAQQAQRDWDWVRVVARVLERGAAVAPLARLA